MLECPVVKSDKQALIPAVTHVDNTARLQTVSRDENQLLYKLLKSVEAKTGVPILLNTSLNDRNKPIANNIQVILNLVMDTKLDCAAIENKFYTKNLI